MKCYSLIGRNGISEGIPVMGGNKHWYVPMLSGAQPQEGSDVQLYRRSLPQVVSQKEASKSRIRTPMYFDCDNVVLDAQPIRITPPGKSIVVALQKAEELDLRVLVFIATDVPEEYDRPFSAEAGKPEFISVAWSRNGTKHRDWTGLVILSPGDAIRYRRDGSQPHEELVAFYREGQLQICWADQYAEVDPLLDPTAEIELI